jgi:hypothetical protein
MLLLLSVPEQDRTDAEPVADVSDKSELAQIELPVAEPVPASSAVHPDLSDPHDPIAFL